MTTTNPESRQRTETSDVAFLRLLKTAAEWRLLGLLFERPQPGWREGLRGLCAEVGDSRLRAAARRALDASEGEYLRMLGPGGMISPREVAYCGQEDPGRVMAELAGFYEAFGYHPRAEDPMDHIAVECGFVGYLFLKEAFGRADNDQSRATLAADARTQFIDRHLARLAGAVAHRLDGVDGSYLSHPARLLAARVPARVEAVWSAEVNAPTGCGGCSDGRF